MAKHTQFIRHSTANANAYIGYPGEITVDSDLDNLRLHDGTTPGGKVFQNTEQFAINVFRRYTALSVESTPGQLANSVLTKYLLFSNAGAYILPPLTEAEVGTPIVLEATVSGVTITTGDLINEQGVDLATIDIAEDEVVEISKLSTSRWKVTSRY